MNKHALVVLALSAAAILSSDSHGRAGRRPANDIGAETIRVLTPEAVSCDLPETMSRNALLDRAVALLSRDGGRYAPELLQSVTREELGSAPNFREILEHQQFGQVLDGGVVVGGECRPKTCSLVAQALRESLNTQLFGLHANLRDRNVEIIERMRRTLVDFRALGTRVRSDIRRHPRLVERFWGDRTSREGRAPIDVRREWSAVIENLNIVVSRPSLEAYDLTPQLRRAESNARQIQNFFSNHRGTQHRDLVSCSSGFQLSPSREFRRDEIPEGFLTRLTEQEQRELRTTNSRERPPVCVAPAEGRGRQRVPARYELAQSWSTIYVDEYGDSVQVCTNSRGPRPELDVSFATVKVCTRFPMLQLLPEHRGEISAHHSILVSELYDTESTPRVLNLITKHAPEECLPEHFRQPVVVKPEVPEQEIPESIETTTVSEGDPAEEPQSTQPPAESAPLDDLEKKPLPEEAGGEADDLRKPSGKRVRDAEPLTDDEPRPSTRFRNSDVPRGSGH